MTDDPSSVFRQKPQNVVPRGPQGGAVDPSPSPLSGEGGRTTVTRPVWEQFSQNEYLRENNRQAVRSEMDLQDRAARQNASIAKQQATSLAEKWGGENGRLFRKIGNQIEEHDPEQFGDDPVVGPFARKSIWDRDLKKTKAEAEAARLEMEGLGFSELSTKQREEIEAIGYSLPETDPEHQRLKAKLVADTTAKERRAALERQAYDAKVRAFQIEQSGPDGWWEARRNQPAAPAVDPRREAVNAAQAERDEAVQADDSALEEANHIREKLKSGVTAAEAAQLQQRLAQINQVRDQAATVRMGAEDKISGVQQQAQAEKDKPFFAVGDTISGIWDAVKGLGVTAPAAFYQLVEGMERPDRYSESAKQAFAEADAYAKEMQSKSAAEGATDVGSAFRSTGPSLGSSLGTIAATIPASMGGAKVGAAAGGAIGAAVGAPAAGAGAAPGAVIGASIGGTIGGVTAGMAASGSAAYRMAGASFLNEAFQVMNQESIRKSGRPMNEQEMASAYEALLPIAKNTALWEAGPEAVANAITLGAGKVVFGLGKPLLAKFGKSVGGKALAAAGGVAGELSTETLTQVEQGADQEKMVALATGQDPNQIKADWTASGVTEAFKEVAPQTLAMMALMGGGAGIVKGGMLAADRMRGDGQQGGPAEVPPVNITDPELVNTALLGIDPEAAEAAAPEIEMARLMTNPNEGPEGMAESVLVLRELQEIEAEDEQTRADFEEAVEAVKAAGGDHKAIKQAEEQAEAAKVGRATTVRGVLRIAAGADITDLTVEELRGLGVEPGKNGGFKPIKDAPQMVREGADGSVVLTDIALKAVEQRAEQALSTDTQNGMPGDPASTGNVTGTGGETNAAVGTFEVTTWSGRKIQVQAATVQDAEEQAAALADYGDPIQPSMTRQISQPQQAPTNEQASQPQPEAPPAQPDQPGQAGNPEGTQGGTGQPVGGPSAGNNPNVTQGGQPDVEQGGADAQGASVNLSDPKRFDSSDRSMEAKVHAAIHSFEGAGKRFDDLRKRGATDEELMQAISDALGSQGGGSEHGGYDYKGGQSPYVTEAFLPEGLPRRSVKGRELVAMVRDLMGIPKPISETPTPPPDAGRDRAIKAAKKRIDTIRNRSKRLAAAIDTKSGDRAQAVEGKISLNPERIIGEAMDRGMSAKDAAEYFTRVLDEEIRHLAQFDAAQDLWRAAGSPGEFTDWRNEHYGAIWNEDFGGDNGAKGKHVAKVYGGDFKNLAPWQKAMEGIRMMSQGDKATEGAFLWAGGVSKRLRDAIAASLEAIKRIVADISPTDRIKTEIKNLEDALARLTAADSQSRPGDSPSGGKKPASGKPGAGTGGKPGPSAGGGKAASGGEAAPAGRSAAGASLAAGTRVEFDAHDGRPGGTGVIRIANERTASIYPDDNPGEAIGPIPLEKVRVVDTKPQEKPEPAAETPAFAVGDSVEWTSDGENIRGSVYEILGGNTLKIRTTDGKSHIRNVSQVRKSNAETPAPAETAPDTTPPSPTLDQLNDPVWHADRLIEEIDKWVGELTNNGKRKIGDVFGRSEEGRRVKMYLERGGKIRSYVINTKAIGPEATFRINANKATTFEELRKAAVKLRDKLAAEKAPVANDSLQSETPQPTPQDTAESAKPPQAPEANAPKLSPAMEKARKVLDGLFAAPVPLSNLTDYIRTSFADLPSDITFTPSNETDPNIQRIVSEQGIQTVSSPHLLDFQRGFEERTGARPVFFTGGDQTTKGFVEASAPSLIFVRADAGSRDSMPWLLVHELVHVAQRDLNAKAKEAYEDIIDRFIDDNAYFAIQNVLLNEGYHPEEITAEIQAYVFTDVISGKNELQLDQLPYYKEFSDAIHDYINGLSGLKPIIIKPTLLAKDSLRSANLPESYTKPIPQDRMVALIDAAQSLVQEGVNTPETLAGAMKELAPDNKALPFTQSFWFAMKAVGAEGVAEPDWSAIYEGLEASTEVDNASTNQDAEIQPETPPAIEEVKAPAKETKAAKKVAKKPETNTKKLKAQKEYLLAALDKAIEEAPEDRNGTWTNDEAQKDAYDARMTANKAVTGPLYKKYGFDVEGDILKQSNRSALADHIESLHYKPSDAAPIIEIEVPGDGTFRIVNDKATLTAFRKDAATRFPTTAARPATYTLGPSGPTAIASLGKPETNRDFIKVAGLFVSTDAQRWVINNVHSDGENVVATDGRRIIVIKRKAGGTAEKPVHFTAKDQKPVKYDEDDKYPDWKTPLPKEKGRAIPIDTATVMKLAIQARTMVEDVEAVHIWEDADGKLGFTLDDPNTGTFAGGEANPETAKRIAVLNVNYLFDAMKGLRWLGHEKAQMEVFDDSALVNFTAPDVQLVVMGMRESETGMFSPFHPLSKAAEEDEIARQAELDRQAEERAKMVAEREAKERERIAKIVGDQEPEVPQKTHGEIYEIARQFVIDMRNSRDNARDAADAWDRYSRRFKGETILESEFVPMWNSYNKPAAPKGNPTISEAGEAIKRAYPYMTVRTASEERKFIAKAKKNLEELGIKGWQFDSAIEDAKTEKARNSNGRIVFMTGGHILRSLLKAGDIVDPNATPQESAPKLEPTTPKKPRKQKGPSPIDLLENYFRPGKIVKGYGGDDRVISFDRGDGDKWSVTVQSVDDVDNRGPRNHSTMPSNKDLIRAWQNREDEPKKYPSTTPAGHEYVEAVKGREWQVTSTETGEVVKISTSIRDGFIAETEGTAKSSPGIGFQAALMWADNYFEQKEKKSQPTPAPKAETPAKTRTQSVRLREAEQRLRKRFPDGFEIKDARGAFDPTLDRDYSYFGATTLVQWLKKEGAIVDKTESGRTMDSPGFDGWAWTGKEAKNDYTEESFTDTAVESTEDIEQFTPEQAASELAKRGITLEKEATKTGKAVWRIKGKTFDVKDTLKSLGAKWYAPAKAWSIFSDEDPTQKIANALAGKPAPESQSGSTQDDSGAGNDPDEDARLRELRERLDGSADERRDRGDAISSVDAGTAALIRRGLKFGMPADVVEDQIEDIAMITSAFQAGKPAFILGNGAGTGKTFVLGGAIREMRAKGAKSFVYVTMNQDLIEQIKADLADFGVSDVKFHTYSEMSTKPIPMEKDAVLIFDEAHNVKNEQAARGEKSQPMMANAKFTIFASATPFENPVQAAYLGGTGLFNEAGGHVEWGKAYGASVKRRKFYNPQTGQEQIEETLYWRGGKLEDGLAARQWFVKQGIMVTRPMRLPMEMVESTFTKFKAADQWVTLYDRVTAAYDDAMAKYRNEDGSIRDARENSQVSMHMTNTVKRILEASKVEHAVSEAKRILADTDAKGSPNNVVIFVETKADRWLGRYKTGEAYQKENGRDSKHYTFPEMAEMMDSWKREAAIKRKYGERPGPSPFAPFIMDIAKAMYEADIEIQLPSVEDEIVEALGGADKVGVYTGSVTGAKAKADKEAFLRGEKRVIVATMAKGGTGLSLHDKVGNRPTVQININLPWVATGVDQVSGRVARYGLQSKAFINWLFADNIAFERMLANRVGRRMRDMGALVKGIDMKAAKVLTDDFDFEGSADVKQTDGEVEVAESDIFEQAERLEKNRRQKGDQSHGFFETPFPLAALMTQISGARGKLLEPSAGRGNLIRFAKDKAKSITAVEFRQDNTDYLKGQGYDVTNADFLEVADTLGLFNTIHMNPPFERKAGTGWQDMAHVMKAFSMLAPDGRLVAIVGEGGFFRSDKQSQEFRQFLSDNGAVVIKLPEGAFKNSGTGVRTRMLVIDQNVEAGRTDIDLSDIDPDTLRSVADAVPARRGDSSLRAAPLPQRVTPRSPEWKNLTREQRVEAVKAIRGEKDNAKPHFAELSELEMTDWPFSATYDGQTVEVVGPAADFDPNVLKGILKPDTSPDRFRWWRIETKDGKKQNVSVHSLTKHGRPLLPRPKVAPGVTEIPTRNLFGDRNALRAAPVPPAEDDGPELFQRRAASKVAAAQPKLDMAREQAKEYGPGSIGVDPTFSNPGSTTESRVERDIIRAYDLHTRTVRNDRDVMAKGREYLEKYPDDVERLLLENAFSDRGGDSVADYKQHAINLLLDRKTREAVASGDPKRMAEITALHFADIAVGRETARSLRMRMDRFMTPAERAEQAIAGAIFKPSQKVEARTRLLPPRERKAYLEKAAEQRIREVEKELAKLGLRLDQVIGKNRDLQLENSRLVKEVLKKQNLLDQGVVKMVQKGATIADIKRRYGKEAAEKAQETVTKTREEIARQLRQMLESGMTREQIREAMKDTLKAANVPGAANSGKAPDIDAIIEAMLVEDFGLPAVVPTKRVLPRTKKPKTPDVSAPHPLSSDWSRPEFTDGLKSYEFDTKDRAGIMERVEIIRGLAGAVGKIDSLKGKQREQAERMVAEIDAILAKYGTDSRGIFDAGRGIEDYRFDIEDIAQVAAVSRAISQIDADVVDKATEWFYASMLSGLQTMLVNATAILPAAWEMTFGRGIDMAINTFVKDPMAAQYGEAKYLLRAMKPAWSRALSNFQASMAAQHPMFDRDVNAMEVDWDKILGGGSHRMIGSISGKKGDWIRVPMRLLTATDDFNRTLIACAEVGAYAYRLAKAKGLQPGSPEFDTFVKKEVNTPGSFSYHMASQKASSAIFSNPLPGQRDPHAEGENKTVPVRDIGDLAGFVAGRITDAIAKEHHNLAVKALAAMLRVSFFPFQRTPFNIIRKGMRHTLNPISLIDIALGVADNSFVKNDATGKREFKWNAKGRNPELITRIGQQLQGSILLAALVATAAGEGDDDDMDKPFVITGSAPFTPQGRAERDARMRSGVGPFRISFRRKDGSERFGFNYGRIEPLATTLSATIDTIKSFKRSWRAGQNNQQALEAAMGGLVAQAQDKTFMRGVNDLIALTTNVLASPDLQENRKFHQFLAGRIAMVVPNIIKQPIREGDTMFRERSNGFMEELLYQVAPTGQKPAKVDPYGREARKPVLMDGGMADAIARSVDIGDTGTDKVHPVDQMLIRWRDSGKWAKAADPDNRKPWFPAPILKAEFRHARTGKSVEMDATQLKEFREMAGKRTLALLKLSRINYDNPTERDVEAVKQAVTKARSEMKQRLAIKFSR